MFFNHNIGMQFLRWVYVRSKETAPTAWGLAHEVNSAQYKNILCWVCWFVAVCFLTIEFRWTGYSLWRNRKRFSLHVLCYTPSNSVFKMSCNTRGRASWGTRAEGVKLFQKVISIVKNKTVRLSRNVWHQPPSNGVPYTRMTKTSTTPLRKSKNS